MAGTTDARAARYLTIPTAVEYCGVLHCGAFASMSILYGALDSILFIAVCSFENISSPPHSILDNHIPVRNIDRKFHPGRFKLVLEAKLGSSNVTCALRQFPIWYLFGNSGDLFVCWLLNVPATGQCISGAICTDNFTCCHTEIEAADQTFHLTQSQYTDTGPASPSADPISPGAWQGSHWSANV